MSEDINEYCKNLLNINGGNKKINSEEARKMLESSRGNTLDDGWINHSLCVGYAAGVIATALNEKGQNLDVDKAITLGMLHDIGKMVGPFEKHILNGYKYMKEEGYDEEYYNISLVHSYLNNDILCTAGAIPYDIPVISEFIKNHEYTMYEKIINLCDLMCTQKVNPVDTRLIDVIIRKGAYSNTQYHVKETYKLKEYFDNLLGYNLYNLFPEIKENL